MSNYTKYKKWWYEFGGGGGYDMHDPDEVSARYDAFVEHINNMTLFELMNTLEDWE